MIINRITANTMEPRGCVAEYDTHDDRYIIRCTVQAPHRTRAAMASMFKVPETRIRVIADNVGGGFGMKGNIFPEYIIVPVAARLLERPVRWVCERSEGLLTDEHSRDNVVDAEFALDRDGKFLGLRVRTYAAIGAYHTSDRAAGPPLANVGCLAATYTTPAFHVEVSGVMTHTQLTGHYRGAGRPENAYMIETMIDLAARELDIERREQEVAAQVVVAEQGRWYTALPRPLFAAAFIIYTWKVVVWDKVLGLGSTPALSGEVAQWATAVLTAYFGGRSLEKVARILGRK